MIKKRKRNKKWILWLVWLLLVVASVAVCYLVWDSYFREEPVDVQGVEGVELKKEIAETPEGKKEQLVEDVKEEKKVEQYDGEDPNEADALSGVITYAGVNGGILMIRVNIDQYLGSGQCRLVLVKDGVTIYSDMANVVSSASTATCEGFDVPTSELGGGALEIMVNVNSGEKNGVIRGEVRI